MSVQIARYDPTDQADWDAFVRASRNGSFLFIRAYMEYHQDRFVDHSLIARDGGAVVALLPANQREDALVSHGGLTFGGWLVGEGMRQARMMALFDALADYARAQGFATLVYKPVPHIYARASAEEDLYALFRHGAHLIDRRPMTVIARAPIAVREAGYSTRKRRNLRKAEKAGVVIAESGDLAGYWALLEQVLATQHAAKPVHTLAEIARLAELFPEHIRLFGAFVDVQMVAGVLVYVSDQVARAQYIASNEHGRAVGALDLLIDHLACHAFADKAYLDLGTSIEPKDGRLNEGLIAHKEEFGGHSVMSDTYQVTW
jgi:alpha-D-ribose 1-methylphosphonate 5-triphosphate synthase subunit PhnG